MVNRAVAVAVCFGGAICVAGADAVAESSIARVFTGLRTRTTCIEELKGLGDATLVFEKAVPDTYSEAESMNEEFYWDAVLVTSSSSPVNVKLHCVRVRLPAIKGVSDEPWNATFSELVRR